MATDFRVFLSAVTSEFGTARDALAADLRSRGMFVRVQSDFRQEADSDTTLKKLHDYIHDCSAVVCVIGIRSGACPPPAAAAPFLDMLPSGVREASYTQWEFFFARHYRRRLSIYIANPNYAPDQPVPKGEDRPELQRGLVRHIVEEQGLDRSYFSNIDQLARAVLKEDWPKKVPVKPIVLPYTSLGRLFKGRERFLRRLHESLTRDGGGTTAGTALYGMGGTGKTRAAVEYAWAYREHYTALLFVIADDPKALSGNLAALSVHLLLRHSPDRDAAEYVRRQAVVDWLNENPGWLLILDNIDTGAALTEAETLIGQLTGGHVVMTSRLANFPGAIAPLELDVLRPKDAADFLLARTSKLRRAAADDKATARQLALDLGCLALALEHAGAYIVWRKESLRSYRELWESNRETVLNWSDPIVTHYPRAIAVTWQTSVAQLTDPARHLLERLAWLALDPVPEFLLDVPIPEAAGGNLRDALADLAAYSLASRDAVQPQFSVHRLVQEVTRNSLDAAGKAQLRRLETLGWIDAAFEGDPTDLHTWPRLDPLVTHARAIIGDADAAETTEPTSRLVGRFAVFSLTKSVVAEGEQLMRRALTVAEESLEPQYSNPTLRLSNIRRFVQDINRFIDAAPVMLRALTIDEKSFGTNNTEVMLRLQMLQQLLKDTDQLVDAAALKLGDLALDQKSFTPGDPREALRLDTIGGLLKATELLAGFFEAMGKGETEIRTAIAAVTAKLR